MHTGIIHDVKEVKKRAKLEKRNALSGELVTLYERLKCIEAQSLNSIKLLSEFKSICKETRKLLEKLEDDSDLNKFFKTAFQEKDGQYATDKALTLWDGFIEFEVETLAQFGVKEELVRHLINDAIGDIGPLNPPDSDGFKDIRDFKDLLSDFSKRCCIFQKNFGKAPSIYDARRLTITGMAAVLLGLTNFRSSHTTGSRVYSDTGAQIASLRLTAQFSVLGDESEADQSSNKPESKQK